MFNDEEDKKKNNKKAQAGTEELPAQEEVLSGEGEQPEQDLPAADKELPAAEQPKEPSELEKAQADAADFKDKWMRTAAEFDNFRKRNEQTRRNAYLDGKADILVKVLPVGDNLELALRSCAEEQTKKGIEMVLRSFRKLLEEEGIEEIDPKDEEFDPAFCEAVMSEPAAEGVEPGYVIEVFRKGYKKGGKVIRYAQVKVTT